MMMWQSGRASSAVEGTAQIPDRDRDLMTSDDPGDELDSQVIASRLMLEAIDLGILEAYQSRIVKMAGMCGSSCALRV